MANVVVTGGSGYLGGSLLAYLKQNKDALPAGTTLYGLVRSEDQAEKTRKYYGIEPVIIDLQDEDDIFKTLEKYNITVIAFLIDARNSEVQLRMIRSLAKIQKKTGKQTHLIQTAGAKGFSSHAGFPLDPPVSDEDERLFEIQTMQKSKPSAAQTVRLWCSLSMISVHSADRDYPLANADGPYQQRNY